MRKNISPTKRRYIAAAMKRKINNPLFSDENSDEEKDDLLSEDLYQEKVRYDTFLNINSFFYITNYILPITLFY